MIDVARQAILSIGGIQAQVCHTGRCPTGVATQRPWLVKGLDPDLKSARLASCLFTFRMYLSALAHACGEAHPALVPLERIEILDGLSSLPAREVFGYEPGPALLALRRAAGPPSTSPA